ncbi:hypothetical protein NX059_003858 [Plenodomus lindquistii]|nr:hypothetical protein NX059_003858 [Plenodomus lindquistii]
MAAVAQSRIQDDVHPLLRHPRPIKRDSARAQHMLDLIADSEEKLKELHREKSVTTKWLERPLYQHLEVSNVEPQREKVVEGQECEKEYGFVREEKKKALEDEEEESDADLLDRWTNPNRPTSVGKEAVEALVEPKTQLSASFAKKQPHPLNCPRPVSYNAQHLLSPEWTASPSTMSPNTPAHRRASSYLDSNRTSSITSSTSSVESSPRIVQQQQEPQTWAGPAAQVPTRMRAERPISYQPQSSQSLGSPETTHRPRPMSFATYHQRNRSSTKIASSRGLRNNSYPNFSRPPTSGTAKAVPGEHMENDLVYNRYADDEVGPPTPASARPASSRLASSRPVSPIQAVVTFPEQPEEVKVEKKQKNRWSAIPDTFKKLAARRRSSAAMQDKPAFEVRIDDDTHNDQPKMHLTEENLAWYEREVSQAPSTPRSRLSVVDLIPTPTYSPTDLSHPQSAPRPVSSSKQMGALPLPFAPWTDGGPPSPAATADRRRSSGQSSLSPSRNPALHHRPSAEAVPQQQQLRPASMYSHRSSLVLPSPPGTATTTAPAHANHPHHHHHQASTFSVPASPRFNSSRLGTPIPDPTCILCKTSKPSYDFVDRRITANCWHEPATCLSCMQSWIHSAVKTQGWDRCACPECGEAMSGEDIGAFVDVRYLR